MDRRKRSSDEASAPPSHAEVLYEGQWYTAEFVKDVAAGVRVRAAQRSSSQKIGWEWAWLR